jgi:hypothetical protein
LLGSGEPAQVSTLRGAFWRDRFDRLEDFVKKTDPWRERDARQALGGLGIW